MRLQRARGAVALGMVQRRGQSRIADLRQAGSAKLFLPKVHHPMPQAVVVNTAGGLASGDRFDIAFEVGSGAGLTATTQTAERAYRAEGPPAEVDVRLMAGAGAALAWLPQETILFEQAKLRRRLTATLKGDARLLILESLVFGRAAMGEDLTQAHLHDRWRVTRDGTLIYGDDLRLAGDVAPVLAARAGFAGHRAAASLAYLAPRAADMEKRLEDLALPQGVRLARSAWDGVLSLRCLAPCAQSLRVGLAAVLHHFHEHPLPRVWQS